MDIKDAILNRQSVRKFKDEIVKDENLDEIFNLATKVPSAFNWQLTSIVYTTDKEKINEIAKLCGGQPQVANAPVFILLVTDLYRAKVTLQKKDVEIKDDLGPFLDMMKIDAGLMAYAINMAAINFGYGCTIIGGVYQNQDKLKELLDIPKISNIAIGMTLGIPEDELKINTKPKISSKVIAMRDKYDKIKSENALFDYDDILADWFDKIGVKNQAKQTDVLAKIIGK